MIEKQQAQQPQPRTQIWKERIKEKSFFCKIEMDANYYNIFHIFTAKQGSSLLNQKKMNRPKKC